MHGWGAFCAFQAKYELTQALGVEWDFGKLVDELCLSCVVDVFVLPKCKDKINV